MREVSQRRVIPDHVKTEDEIASLPPEQRGDCMRASIAAVFGIDYEDAYDCWEEDDWWGGFQEWLAGFGLYVRIRPAKDFAPWRGVYLVDGRSPRGPWGHMAVGAYGKLDDGSGAWGWKVVWDPHPSRGGFANGIENVWELVCFDPSLIDRRSLE